MFPLHNSPSAKELKARQKRQINEGIVKDRLKYAGR
jgi:hypothetical protein